MVRKKCKNALYITTPNKQILKNESDCTGCDCFTLGKCDGKKLYEPKKDNDEPLWRISKWEK